MSRTYQGLIIDDETGEVVVDWTKDIEMLSAEYKALRAEAEDEKVKARNADIRAKSLENKAEFIRRQITEVLGGETYESKNVSISYKRSKSVYITDINALPSEYIKMTPTAKKTDIANAINAGIAVTGAEIVENISTIIK
jgi:hypothetical protein